VYDPFLGSGTTLIAADQTGRICYGLELDPKYVDVIIQRWQGATGQQATLEGTGQAFEAVRLQRAPETSTPDQPPNNGGTPKATATRRKGRKP